MPLFTTQNKPLLVKKHQFTQLDRERMVEALERLLDHLTTCFPQPMSRLDDKEKKLFLIEGTRKASDYGLHAEYEIQTYFHCMLTLGVGFEDTEQHATLSRLLKDVDRPNPERLSALVDEVQQILSQQKPE
jgi:hypothetical protein